MDRAGTRGDRRSGRSPGGTSFVPAVRAQFEARFGAEKIETGDQLVSIAYGLALIAKEDDISRWAA